MEGRRRRRRWRSGCEEEALGDTSLKRASGLGETERHTHTHELTNISTEISNSRHTRVHIITFTHMHAHAEKPQT